MAPSRHKHVLEKVARSSRQGSWRGSWRGSRRLVRVGVPAAAALTLATVTVGVVTAEEQPAMSSSAISLSAPEVRTEPIPARVAPISRSEERVRLVPKPPEVTDHMFAVEAVNVRAKPTDDSKRVGALEWAEKIGISGKTRGAWVEVVVGKKAQWVHSAFLADARPKPEPEPEPEPAEEEATTTAAAPSGVASGSCPTSDVESGLVANAVAVHRAVCNEFPEITSYGGLRADSGAHGTGNAIDIMVSGSLGWTIAEYLQANAGSLGISELIYEQKIWTVDRSGEGWRYMEDRGSATANHYDHVHVTVY